LDAFFGTDKVSLTLTSRAPGLPDAARVRTYDRLHDVVKDVDWARVLKGFKTMFTLRLGGTRG
jgi:hypothetical protein